MSIGMNTIVEVITADVSKLSEELKESHSVRLYSRGGHFSPDQMLPVYFMLMAGYSDDDSYNNLLFSLRDDLKRSEKPFAFIDTPLDEPIAEVMNEFADVNTDTSASAVSGLCAHISIRNDAARTTIAQRALGDMLSYCSGDVMRIGVSLVTKFNLVANAILRGGNKEIPVILYYGIPTPSDVLFLCYAQRTGFDVIIVSPDKAVINSVCSCQFADKIQKEEYPESKPVMPFPQRMVKAKVSTVAYSAERELDSMLYGGDTLFRDRQFSRLDSVVLRTTFEEIELLWDQPAKYRSGFAVKGDRVIVPTFFVKVTGIPNGNTKAYWNYVEERLTPQSIYAIKAPSYKKMAAEYSRMYSQYRSGRTILVDKLRRSPLNKYNFLSEELQDVIFEKMQAIVDDGLLIMDNETELLDYAMYTALNLDKNILHMLQSYDYTKDIPKIVFVDVIQEPFSKLECTQLLLLSYLGFDIIIFTPSGYRNIETCVSDDAYEIHNCGEFVYSVTAPRLKVPKEPRKKSAGFKKLFKKGR
ncbi:MAG: YceG family protein [Huintestinicola sp.]